MVEFALVLPFIIVLFVAVIEFARAALIGITVENCAREGARYATTHPDLSAQGINKITAAARALDVIASPQGIVNVAVSPSSGVLKAGDPVTITCTYTLNTILGMLIFKDGFSFVVRKQCQMIVE